MQVRSLFKSIARSAGHLLLRALVNFFQLMPLRWAMFLSRTIAKIFYFLLRRKRHIAFENIDRVYGQTLSKSEKIQLAQGCFREVCYALTELIYTLGRDYSLFDSIEITGREHLEAAYKSEQGVLVIMAHFGNFPLMLMYCAYLGYPVNVVVKPFRDKGIDEYIHQFRKAKKLRSIYTRPARQCVSQSIRCLRNKEILFFPIDQNFGQEGAVFVDFMGQPAATTISPAMFAQRTGAKVLLMSIVRNPSDHHHVEVKPLESVDMEATIEKPYQYYMQQWTSALESTIRSHPDHWTWMHQRWKTKQIHAKNVSDKESGDE